MDIFYVPDPGDPGMGYAYLAMTLVFIAASITVYRLKKRSKRKQEAKAEPESFEMYAPPRTDKENDRSNGGRNNE
ncbi:hypothetical protein [Salisediminibacterium halotolerans]|uniref:Uncharacterized protein n=2 Tax=Salisediminibacterium halotolerans TaxID=517425 RepID=A0A1H9TJH1_9BACI|nr:MULTISPECIES: hypothetical protein [Salisediminibacterium]RLJ72362.1 hypothetical protein BCL39_2262 [Actinophytocola xinjiangensis]RPE85576.1 hypothetical protein EDD67_2397 [Salisediminibacterium halotolerans]TWG33531.1 hypothetical protein BCL52_2257 [Salisediminibacterium halotolerans]SER97301.1 hypothetical protein SAMN05444126_11049 [Salisediminibacterium haloalkalitolerans]GEL08838.1 hypothetical protein SHA02_22540 [Salisediminibacterium halotolerans]